MTLERRMLPALSRGIQPAVQRNSNILFCVFEVALNYFRF